MTKRDKLAKAIKEGKVRDATTASVFTMVESLNDRLDEEIPQIKNVLSKIKGDTGPKGEQGKKGEQGIQGIAGKDGKDGKDGQTPQIDTAKIVSDAQKQAYSALLPKIPTIEQVEAEIPKLGHEIRDSLELLTGKEKLDKSAIYGLEDYEKLNDFIKNPASLIGKYGVGGSTARNFYQLYDVPQSYSGQSGKTLQVKSTEDGLEFVTGSSTDEKVKYAADDTSAGYLGAKTVAGTGITLEEGTGGDADKLKITNSDPDQVVAFAGGTNVIIGGTYPNFEITDNSLGASAISDEAYGAGWDEDDTHAPSKNAVYDKIESLAGGHDAVTLSGGASTLLALTGQDLDVNTQAANVVYSGPTSGGDAKPTFRALSADDIPDLSAVYAVVLGADDNYVTDDQLLNIYNLSGTNTGDGTYGIANTNYVKIDAADVADDDYAKFTASGLEGRSYSEVLSDIGAEPAKGADDNYVTDAQQLLLLNLSGTNTGDQTDIADFTGTKAEFDTACTDGDFLFVGDAPTAHAASHAVSGGDTVFPADPAADKYLMWDDDPGQLAWVDAPAPEGTAVLSTGEEGGTKFLREDGDGTCSWQTPAGSGDVSKVGTPVDNQVGVWTGDGTIEGTVGLTYDGTTFNIGTGAAGVNYILKFNGEDSDGNITFDEDAAQFLIDQDLDVAGTLSLGANNLTMTGSLGATGAGKLTKVWAVDAEFTNLPTINGGTLATALSLGSMASETATDYITKATLDADSVLTATSDDTPIATTMAEQTVLGRLTGGHPDDIAIGIADNNMLQVDDATAADNDYAKFTANGLEGVPYATVLSDIGALPLAGGTMSGNITLGENTAIALDPAGSADGKYSGITVTGVAGATVAFGDLITLDKDDSRWELVDISVAAAATGDARGVLGMAVSAGNDGDSITILLQGIIRADANFPALTIGANVYASTTGDIVVAQPTTTDYVIRIIGAALTADEIFFRPDFAWITHT